MRDEFPADITQRTKVIKAYYVKMRSLGELNLFK